MWRLQKNYYSYLKARIEAQSVVSRNEAESWIFNIKKAREIDPWLKQRF